MDGVRGWAFSLCAAMVACGVARMLLPKGGLQKIFSITVSVFFLCCLISPVLTGDALEGIVVTDYSIEEIERRAAALEQTAASQSAEAIKLSLEKIVAGKLAEMGINGAGIAINISTGGQNGPEVESVDVTLPREYEARHEALLLGLSGELGLKIRLGYA